MGQEPEDDSERERNFRGHVIRNLFTKLEVDVSRQIDAIPD